MALPDNLQDSACYQCHNRFCEERHLTLIENPPRSNAACEKSIATIETNMIQLSEPLRRD